MRVSRKRVIRLMLEEGVKARRRKRFSCTTLSDHDQPVAANLLDRQFTADRPNQRWIGDTTEFVIGESRKLYLAAMLDLYSRFIVGWAVSAVNDRHLTVKALERGTETPLSGGRGCFIIRIVRMFSPVSGRPDLHGDGRSTLVPRGALGGLPHIRIDRQRVFPWICRPPRCISRRGVASPMPVTREGPDCPVTLLSCPCIRSWPTPSAS